MSAGGEFQSMTNVDGVVTKTADARVPVLDRGFLYGDSIYEVFRTYDGVPLFYSEHWARFQNSAALIRMNIGLTLDQLTEEIRATIETTGAPELGLDVYVRYMVTRGEGPVDLFPAPGLRSRYVVVVREVPKWNPCLLFARRKGGNREHSPQSGQRARSEHQGRQLPEQCAGGDGRAHPRRRRLLDAE